ncbi:polymorphic toxin type 30 domain-containing protein, partial [Promicromonospora citrea]
SWAEAGIAIAGAALSLIGLGGAAKAAMGLSKSIAKGAFKQGMKKGWCKLGFGACFVAGTPVLTVDGPRPIEEIRVGDKVWTRNLDTGTDELALVAETFVHQTLVLYHLTIGGQRISTTAEHPFMTADRGWQMAGNLRVGDVLVTVEGTATVQAVEVEERDLVDIEQVYNFHVEDTHTYYVLAGDLPVLVHNNHGGPQGWPDEVLAARNAPNSPMARVPDDAEMLPFTPHSGGGAQKGVHFKWTEDGKTHRFRAHDADGTAPPGSNAAEGPIYRYRVGNKYEMEGGGFAHPQAHNPNSPHYNPEQANATHIPWPSDVPLPWS